MAVVLAFSLVNFGALEGADLDVREWPKVNGCSFHCSLAGAGEVLDWAA